MNPTTTRFLLSGYYGFGNLGDEALLEVIITQLRARFPQATIDVLSATPEETARQFNVSATPRGNLPALQRAIDQANVVLSGGGGLLQSATSLKSLLYYVNIIRQATNRRKTTMIFAQSIGPLDLLGRKTVSEFCRHIDLATVRDSHSLALLQKLLPQTKIERTADPVFLYEPSSEPDPSFANSFDDDVPLAFISIRKANQANDVADRVATAVDLLWEQHGMRSVFFPFGGARDAEISTTIIRRCKSQPLLLPAANLATAAALIARCHVVIGMRLHALILAARFGIPFLALAYDPKVSALVEDLGYPLPCLWSSVPSKLRPPNIESLVERLILEHTSLHAVLTQGTIAMQAAAERNFSLLEDLITHKGNSADR